MDDFEIISSMEASLTTVDASPILQRIDDIFRQSQEEHNILIAINAIRNLKEMARASGLGAAKLLYLIRGSWSSYKIEERFEDFIEATLGFPAVTIDRYIAVWDMYERKLVPDELISRVQSMPLKSQVPIAKAIEQGYDFSEEDWKSLANASNDSEVRAELHLIKGTEPRSNSLVLILQPNGDIIAYASGVQKFVGWLATADAENDEDVQRAIQRIVTNTGITRK